MLDIFSPLPMSERRTQRVAYRRFLNERDGIPNPATWTLSRREERMARYTRPLPRLREIDSALFLREYASFRPVQPMTSEASLLMALVKLNAAEAYGVSQTFGLATERAETGPDDVELLMHMEEAYHTRILLSAALLYGLQITEPRRPPAVLRALIVGIGRAPDLLSRPLLLAAEIVGATTFLNVLCAVPTILKHDPELRDAVEERLIEVLVDEIGHISFNRMVLGRAGLLRARMLLPLAAQGVAHSVPILRSLGMKTTAADANTITTSARLPELVRRAAFVV
ncbi:MAG: hypothetical protein RL701_8097 [Pseudomonadota bacterium]